MKKFVLLLALLFLGGGMLLSFRSLKQKVKNDLGSPLHSTALSPTIIPTVDVSKNPSEKSSLFIPYWAVGNKHIEPEGYDAAIYFGVTPTNNGINTEEAGYTAMPRFLSRTSTWSNRLLTLRMLDSKSNFSILEDVQKQEDVIQAFVSLAAENGFDGVILDLELSALPFNSVISQINGFTKRLADASRKQNLSVGMMMYGDTFYRVRPFEVKTLASYIDHMYIMAYDFSKARGNPGPNFPLSGGDVYGYDYVSLTQDFIEAVSSRKLTVVFGMYGYDWQVDDKQTATAQGEAASTNKIEQTLINSCQYSACAWERDSKSGEIKVTYTDDEKINHIVWFEDNESVNRKKEFLRKQGITSYSYWAYTYF